LTTEALHREIAATKELLMQELECVRCEATLKTDAITKLKEEKFAKVQQQFELLERARLEQKADTKERVDAALTAQKEAAGKSEQSFTKQIDSMRDLMESHRKASDDKIAGLTERMAERDGGGRGMDKLWAIILGAAGLASLLYSSLHK
jgi:hypothetical protein